MQTPTSFSGPTGSGSGSDKEWLRREALEAFVWVTAGLGWLWIAYLTMIETNRRIISWADVAAPSALIAVDTVTWLLSRRKPLVASLIYPVGLLAVFFMHLWFSWHTLTPFLAIPVIIITSAICPRQWLMAITAGSCAALVLVAVLRDGWVSPTYQMVAFIGAFTALASWLGMRNLYIALDWAVYSQERATSAMDALRDRRAELRNLADALEQNQERLSYLNVRLEQAKIIAEEAFRAKQLFAANVSHELRTPLNLITGFSEMMAFSPESYGGVRLPPEYEEDVMEVYRSSKHLLSLVEDVLTLSQLETGRMIVRPSWLDLAGVVRDAVETMRPLMEAKGLSVVLSIETTLPEVHGDVVRIRQVLLNLLGNALRFTERGQISTIIRRDGAKLLIEVSDTGVGIAPEDLPRIFDVFNYPREGIAAQRAGFGLGLAISRRLIEAHGGKLWATSEPGRGSQFIVSLPLSSHSGGGSYTLRSHTAPPAQLEPPRPAILAISEGGGHDLLDHHMGEFRIVHAAPQDAIAAQEQYQPVAIWVNEKELSNQLSHDLAPTLRACPSLPVIVCRIPSHTDLAHDLGVDVVLARPVTWKGTTEAVEQLALEQSVRNILIISRDARMVRLLRRILASLEEPAYQVIEACGEKEGLEFLASAKPDLVFLDVVAIPDASRDNVLKILHQTPEYRDTRVVLIADVELYQEILSVGSISVRATKGFPIPKALMVMKLVIEGLSGHAPNTQTL